MVKKIPRKIFQNTPAMEKYGPIVSYAATNELRKWVTKVKWEFIIIFEINLDYTCNLVTWDSYSIWAKNAFSKL